MPYEEIKTKQHQKSDWITKKTGMQPEIYLGVVFVISLTVTLITDLF